MFYVTFFHILLKINFNFSIYVTFAKSTGYILKTKEGSLFCRTAWLMGQSRLVRFLVEIPELKRASS